MPLKRTRILLLVAFAAGSARADDKAECVAAYSSAQDLRTAGKLVESRRELVVCARAACTDFIARDCSQWLGEIENAMPTIVVAAKNDEGKDVTDVTVTVDGVLLFDHLDGRAVPLNPGSRTFTFGHGDYPPITQQVLVRMGEKNREIEVAFVKPKPIAMPIVVHTPPHDLPRDPPRTLRTLGFVSLGAAGATLVAGSILGIAAIATKSAHCMDNICDPGSVSTIDAEATGSTVLLIGTAVLAATGVVLLLLQPRHPSSALLVTPSGLRVTF